MLQPGAQLGRYRIIQKLGAGGMADVFLAEDTTLGRQVALKVLPPELARDPERIARFEKEVRASAALHHPNIVTLFDVGHEGSSPYYTMALLPGGDLKQHIRQGLEPKQALTILRSLADALGYAHQQGFVHRDIKPENILFDAQGRPVLTDLGIAKALGSGTRMTKTGMSIGTPHYMSPEQARGKEVDGRSDLYSLGVVLYEMLTGRVPFDAEDTFAVGLMHISDPVPELPASLQTWQGLIDRLLAKKPEERFADAAGLMAAIDRVLGGETLERSVSRTEIMPNVTEPVQPPGPVQPGKNTAGQNSGLKWGIAGALLAMLLAGGIWLAQRPSRPQVHASGVAASGTDSSRQERESATQRLEALSQQQKIDRLLAEARQDLQALRLTSPVGNNALEKFEQVLRLEPGNRAAEEGIAAIVGKYLELCDDAIAQGRLDKARSYLDKAAAIRPGADGLRAARGRLASAEQQALQRAEQQRQAALARARQTLRKGQTWTEPVTGMEFVWVPGGCFQMGSPASEASRNDDETQHEVCVDGFWMGKTEVTQGQWQKIMGNNPSNFKNGDNYPVEKVSWNDAQDYIRKLGSRSGKSIRLPTEAEWEYAARAGTSTPFAFGRTITPDQVNYDGNYPYGNAPKGLYRQKTTPVGSFKANAFGLYDMHGIVNEWCQDWYDSSYYHNSPRSNPQGPSSGSSRVVRGGSWFNYARDCRSANRGSNAPGNRGSDLGFRLVLAAGQ
jgi:formylglycine-generating enzyme required for sulfatase activity/serine/threonine protein kinase